MIRKRLLVVLGLCCVAAAPATAKRPRRHIQDSNRMGKPLRRQRVELTHAQTSCGAP